MTADKSQEAGQKWTEKVGKESKPAATEADDFPIPYDPEGMFNSLFGENKELDQKIDDTLMRLNQRFMEELEMLAREATREQEEARRASEKSEDGKPE